MGTTTDVLIPVHAKGLRPGASNRSRLGIRSEPETALQSADYLSKITQNCSSAHYNLERRIVAQHVPTRRWYIEDDEPPKYHCRDHGQLRPPLPRPFRRLLRSTQRQRPQQHREATYVSRYRS
jgi:hypothetical protein